MAQKKGIIKYLSMIKRIRVRRRNKTILAPRPIITAEKTKKEQIKNERYSLSGDVETTTGKITFNHKIIDPEFKLKYLNLKDLSEQEYGRFFPPFRSTLVIIDDNSRQFQAMKVGNNQISGDLTSFFNKNHIKTGDIITVEYNRNEISENGDHIIHLLPQNKEKTIEEETIENKKENEPVKTTIRTEKEEETSPEINEIEQKTVTSEILKEEKTPAITFDHEITDFELRLKYLNLRDFTGKEFGTYLPPINSQLVIIDEKGNEYSITRVGRNQISGDLASFFNENNLKQGDVLSIEYNKDETSSDGRHVIHIKFKNE